jgi:arsenate reductase
MPLGEVHPLTKDVLHAQGLPVATLRSKSLDQLPDQDFDLVVTVCDRAANDDCPAFPGAPLQTHWGVPDPVRAELPDAPRIQAFQAAYTQIARKVDAFAALDHANLTRPVLQQAIDEIGRTRLGDH